MKKVTFGIVKSFAKLQRKHPGLCLPDLNFGDCDSIEAAVEKYKSLSIHRFEDGEPVDGGGAFYEVGAKAIGARLAFVSREAFIAAKRNSQVNWDKLANWYGFLPEWAETPERYAARRATEKQKEVGGTGE